MSHAANLAAIMADHDMRDAARIRNSRTEHITLVLLGKVCEHPGCYNKPGALSTRCFGHRNP